MPAVVSVLNTKRSYRPTKVITIHCEIGHCVMYVPILGKTVALANLASIAAAVSTIVSFYKSGVNRIANCRGFYRSFHLSFAAKDRSQINLNHTAFSASFMDSGVNQALC